MPASRRKQRTTADDYAFNTEKRVCWISVMDAESLIALCELLELVLGSVFAYRDWHSAADIEQLKITAS